MSISIYWFYSSSLGSWSGSRYIYTSSWWNPSMKRSKNKR